MVAKGRYVESMLYSDTDAERWQDEGFGECLAANLLPQWEVERYHLVRTLMAAPRSGGQVELYMDTLTQTPVVAKRIPSSRVLTGPAAFSAAFPTETENPWEEMRVMQQISYWGSGRPWGVCASYGAYIDGEGDMMLLSEYIPGGDLFDYAANLGPPGKEREEQVYPIICSLIATVLTLHTCRVAHCDISLENALLRVEPKLEVALIDFGMAVCGGDVCCVDGVRGKPSYQAPEMHTEQPYDGRSADLFACGVAAYALAIGGYPWTSTRPGACSAFKYAWEHGLEAYIKKRTVSHPKAPVKADGRRQCVASCLSPRLTQLLEVLLHPDPQRRHCVVELLQLEQWRFVPQVLAGG